MNENSSFSSTHIQSFLPSFPTFGSEASEMGRDAHATFQTYSRNFRNLAMRRKHKVKREEEMLQREFEKRKATLERCRAAPTCESVTARQRGWRELCCLARKHRLKQSFVALRQQ